MATIREQIVDDENIKRISKNLRNIRDNMGISQEEAAFRCGISTRHLCDIENCKVNFSASVLFKIVDGLGITINDLCAK